LSYKNILIISDIEGSSGCWNYDASAFLTDGWFKACVDMSLDVDAVVKALFKAGVEKITVKDFHRTGYNLIPELIDNRVNLVHGYKAGPVPGIGDPYGAEALLMIGMHASSGSGGFLAHTMTSRISFLEVNGKAVSEAELFSSSLYSYGIVPIFFSGCPVACAEAEKSLPGINSYPAEKKNFKTFDKDKWRKGLASFAVSALKNNKVSPFILNGPFKASVKMRDGKDEARKLAQRWNFLFEDDKIFIENDTFDLLYYNLIRLCYLYPAAEKFLRAVLPVYNIYGRYGLYRLRKRISYEKN
jgi:D-aminopeptidase